MIFLTSRDLKRILRAKNKVKIKEFNLKDVEINPNDIKDKIKKSFLKDSESYYVWDGKELKKFGIFWNGFYYKLVPTKDAPALEISGVKMHRVVNTTPWKDAQRKVNVIKIKGGRVLDSCTGLGYTAINAAKYADEVITVEKDIMVIEIAQINPWSKELFENPGIKLIIGDIFEKIDEFGKEEFDYIIHDPPKPKLAPHLYSKEFYEKLFRVLKKEGRGYIYTTRENRYKKGIIKRIESVGFKVKELKDLDGVLVYK